MPILCFELPSETLAILEGRGKGQKIPEECLGLM